MMTGEKHSESGNFRESVLRWLPTFLLICIAVSHFVLVRTEHLSAWKGAGFGMFSTTDGGSTRHFHVYAMRAGGKSEMKIPKQFSDIESRTRELPTDRRLNDFARTILDYAPKDSEAIRVELWRTDFHPQTLEPQSRLLRVIEMNRDEF